MFDSMYNFKETERKYSSAWLQQNIYSPDLDKAKNPFYNLMMFPYPSAEGLHVGNCFAFIGADIFGRYKKMCGFDVFEPMGFDAFGIHSENYALKVGKHPKQLTESNISNFVRQLKSLGLMLDWQHIINTTKAEYYRWTQWIFLQLYKNGIVERKLAPVNWCPSCRTVLADSQVINGKCERCDLMVEQRNLKQWFIKITNYADRLLGNIKKLDWSDVVIKAQTRKISYSEGAFILFSLSSADNGIKVFTTRPDTIFGTTYLVIAPEHDLVPQLTTSKQQKLVDQYIVRAKLKTKFERSMLNNEPTGVFTGSYAVNSITDKKVPVWISDYVLTDYGTGAVMGVPAHDSRDFLFAKKMGLPIIEVVSADGKPHEIVNEAFDSDGILINSGEYNGLKSKMGGQGIVEWLEKNNLGKKGIVYGLRDWCVSRQRYWGPPIPIIYCNLCGCVPVPERDLPVILPESSDYIPDGSGHSPLERNERFKKTICPQCGRNAERETDVSDNFLDSAWYHLRYLATDCHMAPFNKERMQKWLPIHSYIGGKEHAEGHLLYFRFITMVLHDLGYVPFEEPVLRFRAHGVITKNGAKMSKSKGNVVNPDEYVEKYGADVFRLYLMFIGPFTQGGDFNDSGIDGCKRFIENIHTFISKGINTNTSEDVVRLLHLTIEKVTKDIEQLSYNTAIAQLMTLFNEMRKLDTREKELIITFIKLLCPFAPYLSEKLWERLRPVEDKSFLFQQSWPISDKAKMESPTKLIVIQINGKVKDKIIISNSATESEIKTTAFESDRIKIHIGGKKIKNIIYVPNKLLNIVL